MDNSATDEIRTHAGELGAEDIMFFASRAYVPLPSSDVYLLIRYSLVGLGYSALMQHS